MAHSHQPYDAAPAHPADRAHDLANSHDTAVSPHEEFHSVHVVPLWLLAAVFGILMFLTVLTYAVTYVNFGYQVNLLVAIGIAVVKAIFVCLYFMHLRWDNPFNTLCLLSAIVFVGLFIVIASLDTGQYKNLRDAYVDQQSAGAVGR